MDILTFIARIIESIAWPIVALAILIIFRKPIGNIIENIESLQHKDTIAKFKKSTEDISQQINQKIPTIDISESKKTSKKETKDLPRDAFDEIYYQLEESPRLAIGLAWSKIHVEAILALKRHNYFESEGKISISPMGLLFGLQQKKLLNEEQIKLFSQLRQLRNNTIHNMSSRILIPEEIALNYIESAKKMYYYLKSV